MPSKPSRGEVWYVDLDPIEGHEQAGKRPCLIISDNRSNHGHSGLVTILPITSTKRPNPFHVPISPPEGGVRNDCVIMCDQIRTVSVDERLGQCWGTVVPGTMATVEDRVRIYLGLKSR